MTASLRNSACYHPAMDSISRSSHTAAHLSLIDDYQLLDCAEDKLAWLMERQPNHQAVSGGYCTPERRVPGCLSGLWLHFDQTPDGMCSFSARSESAMVQGVVSFLCDLYSGRSPEDVLSLGSSLAQELKLEGVLSLTRRRAVASALSFFAASAAQIASAIRVA